MDKRYIDPYVVCPYYSCEESSVARKIHCAGYKKGVYVHLYFKTKELKKVHVKCFCKNQNNYQKCPIYHCNSEYKEEGNE